MSENPGSGQTGAHTVVNRHHLLAQLGRGGMGVVRRAYDEVLGREVTLKEVRALIVLATRDKPYGRPRAAERNTGR